LSPLWGCQNVIYGGDTEGGRGSFKGRTPHATVREAGILLITLVVNLVINLLGYVNYYHYLCGVTFLIGGDRVDSSLPYIFL
jgi:hypothetical protein